MKVELEKENGDIKELKVIGIIGDTKINITTDKNTKIELIKIGDLFVNEKTGEKFKSITVINKIL